MDTRTFRAAFCDLASAEIAVGSWQSSQDCALICLTSLSPPASSRPRVLL